MLQFDAATSAMLERIYHGRDFVKRRLANVDALDPGAGQHVLDIGCGTGLMLKELARAVGSSGQVTGLDPSPDMLAKAREACAGDENVSVLEGSADALPFADATFDGAVSVQVFEYIDDLAGALAECRRVLRPGGRLVIGDMDFNSLSWHSAEPERLARMCRAYEGHLVHVNLPGLLPGLLGTAGFRHVASHPIVFFDTGPRADGLAGMTQILMANFARRTGALSEDDIAVWVAEQEALAASGHFYFSITHVVTVAEAV